MANTRAGLLDKFKVLSEKHYDGNVPCSITSLLAELVAHVPETGLDTRPPYNRIWYVGEFDSSEAVDKVYEFLEEIYEVHYNYPIELPLEVWLSSPGGDVDGGGMVTAVLNDVRRDGRKVHIHVSGAAMSTAFDILQCADHRSCEPTALLMTHNEHFGLPDSDAENVIREGEASKARAKLVYDELAKRTGRTAKYYVDKVKGLQWYITPDEALAEGLIDEIAVSKPWPLTPAQAGKLAAPRKRTAKKPKAEETPASE